MDWRKVLAYITGMVDEELLLRNEYLAAENQILMVLRRQKDMVVKNSKALPTLNCTCSQLLNSGPTKALKIKQWAKQYLLPAVQDLSVRTPWSN